MIRAAVLGSPISHSLSPTLHKRAYEILGVAGFTKRLKLAKLSSRSLWQKQSPLIPRLIGVVFH